MPTRGWAGVWYVRRVQRAALFCGFQQKNSELHCAVCSMRYSAIKVALVGVLYADLALFVCRTSVGGWVGGVGRGVDGAVFLCWNKCNGAALVRKAVPRAL